MHLRKMLAAFDAELFCGKTVIIIIIIIIKLL